MTEKYIPYKYNGEIYDIPESKSAEFEKYYPSATIEMHMDGEIYDIPLAHKQEAIDTYGSRLTYAFEKDSENTSSSDNVTEEEDSVESLKPTGPTFSFSGFSPMGAQTRSEDSKEAKVTAEKKDEGPSVGESLVKGAGAGFTRAGKGLLAGLNWLSSGYTYNDPETGEAKRTEDYDTQMRDKTNTLRNAYVLAGETADRLSKEADPTGGEKGFVDLISEGKLGTALQKGVATMAESLPMTLSAYNPYTMALNFVSMAADNYGEETLNNPDIDPWKRGVYAIGTAAFEQAVEKFADPVFKYIGGGKGAGKITEEMAKEIMEKGTKDAVKNIAQRIFQALGRGTVKTLKDAGGEGLEEIVTSLGTDALGSALDAIDGNDDYGFSAQWKQYKAEHPNADRMAFAEKKAKEYVDAFLGGALSGGYMSGPLNVASETSMFISDSKNMNQMQEAREKGATLGLANMYDLNDVANEQVENAAKSMVNENGETMLSREFISTLSSDEAYAISRSERLSPQQKVEFQQLANAKAMQEGLRSKLDSDLENNVNAQKVLIEHVADNGIVVAGFVDGNPVYVKGGVEKNGAITLPNGENGPVIVINALTGEQTTINSNEIQKGVSQSAEEYSTWVEGMLRDNDARNREVARNTMSPRAKLKAVTPYVGKKMYIDLGGGIIEVGIQNVSPESGTVLIKGKKGDLGGQSMVTLNASTFYDSIHRDDDGNPMLAEGEVEVMDEMPAEEEAPVADEVPVADVIGDEDFREQAVTILIDGVPTNVYVTSQDNTSDSIVYEYEDANGNKKSGSSTIGAFKGAMQQAEEYKPEEPTAIEGVETDVKTPSVTEEPAPVESAPREVPVTPETIDWDMLFDNDPETFFTELQNQFGEDTADVINDFIATAEEDLASLEKKKGKTMNDRIKDLQRKSSLKLRIGTLYDMLNRLKPKSEPIAEPIATEEDAPVESPTTPPANESAPTVEGTTITGGNASEPIAATTTETPAENEGEFIFDDGDVKNPLVLEMPNEEGTTNKIFLAEKDGKWGSAAYVVLDDGNESGTPRIQIQTLKYDTKEDAIKAALSYFDFYKNMKKDSPSTKTDAFVQYIKDTYLPKEATAESDIAAPTEPEAKVETPAPVQQAPVAPTKVADPIRESQKKEKHLATQLKRYDLSPEQKQDMAFNVGKSVADMFATREEYEAYAENATDLGDYNADFERGVDESFDARTKAPVVSEPAPVSDVKPTEKQNQKQSKSESKSKGGAIQRMYNEFKAQTDKLSAKVGMKDFVAKNDKESTLSGVYKKDGYEHASDSHILAQIKAKYPKSEEGKVYSLKTGQEIEGRVPRYDLAIASHLKDASEVNVSIDDMIAYGQTLDEIKKGMFKDTNLLMKLGDSAFKSELLLKAAKMAKQHGLTKITQHPKSKALAFTGAKGVVLVMPVHVDAATKSVLDVASGDVNFSEYILIKTPTTLKGIETAKNTLEAYLANSDTRFAVDLVDGNVVYRFPSDEIRKAKENAKDSNTYNALEDIEKNGLVVPMSKEDVDKIFKEDEDDGILYRSGVDEESDTETEQEDVEAEMDAIKEKAIKDGTFMKAPNGKPTNLTERQWLQVRTKAFKKWFGDWIKQSRIEKLRNSESIKVKGDEYKGKYELNKKSAFRYINEQLKGTYKNEDTGDEIQVSYIGADKVTSHDYNDPIHLASIVHIPKLIKDSIFITEEPNDKNNKKFDSYRYYVCGLNINGEEYTVKIVVGVKGKDTYYDHHLTSIEKGKLIDNSGPVATGLDEDLFAISAVKDKRLISILQNNSSKVVDENGEPLVVYHGSPYGAITEFDRKGHSVSGLREFGTYFSTNKKLAQLYAYARQQAKGDIEKYELEKARLDAIIFNDGTPARVALDAFDELDRLEESQKPKVYEVFLNLRNPKVFDAERSNGWDGWHKLKQDVGYDIKSGVEAIEAISGHNRAARMSEKYDGIIAKNMADVHSDATEDLMGDVFLVFDETPSNIKSATDNVGTFDAENPNIKYRRSDIQNAAVDYLAGEPRLRAIENAVNEEAAKLGVAVTYKTREEMPKGHKNDKGYYNTKTGEIVVCTENNADINDAIQTIIHEAVAHKGLRQLMGDRFDEFINRVYESLDAETKAKVDKLAEDHYKGNKAVAMEEYMASLAESENFNDNTVWSKIKAIFEDIINKILNRDDIKIGDNELRYILRASYNNMVNPRNMETVRGWAQDQMMRVEYKINEATPEIMSRTGINPTEIAKATAAEVYANHVSATWNEFQRQFQDAMQPVRVAYDAIQQETGNVPIEDYENYILIQNQSPSRSRVEIDNFQRKFYSPIIKQVKALIDKIMESRGWKLNDEKKRSEVYKEVRQYLIAKHGLERNKYYQEHKMRHLKPWEKQREIAVAQSELDAAVEAINSDTSLTDAERELQIRQAQDVYNAAVIEINEREVPDVRDYAGLTALFGMDAKEFKKAEEEAAILVENFEKDNAEMTEELWKRINKATDKTLRHSYECGLISRQQYNDIKGMFDFYIPLRGFDETTAEDVYSYARFEGNRFNPAVHKTGGRTSLADDPIAIIMNMAESEIAQGNKNRAKQALYNFILNRPIVDSEGNHKQNSLMQIESVWYLKNMDENGNEVYSIASPDRERGETYEEFEARMKEKAEKGEAMQSKKGKVDVGLRFQKPSNANAHYIYLKVNGVEKAIYVNGDPKAAEAVNGTYKPKPIYQKGSFRTKYEKVNKAIEFAEDNLTMSNVNRLISSTFTNYSLEFTVRNYFRDMMYSHINIDIKEHDPAYRKKFRKNWRHNNLKSMVTMLKAYRAGEFEGRELNADEAAFVEFMENGGQTGYTLINSVETRKRDLERAIKKMQQGLDKGGVKDSTVFRYTLGAVELLNEASELVTRFAAFKTSRDMGRSVVRSISDAKEITVNFNTKGAQDGKGIFGFLARYLGWSKYFFNASVQGVQNIAAMARANKLKFCSVVGGMAAWGLLMPVIVSAISEMLGGDDDEYWNIPEYDRQNNSCVPVGNGMYAKIPLPIGFREMYALGDMVAAMAFDKKFSRNALEVGTDMANKIASIVLPINPLESMANGLSAWHTMVYTALPSSAQFLIQNMSNVDWKGSPLQKEYTYNENDPAWMKAFENNPAWMKGLSKWCNENIDINNDYKGMDWSPEKLDNTLSNLFGGIYTLIKKTGNSFSMIWNEENRNLSNVPIAGVLLGSGIENDDRFVVDAYFEQKDYYDQRVGTIKTRAKQFGYELDDIFEKKKGKHHPKIQEIYANDNFEFMQEWYKGNKELEKLNKDIQKLELKIAEKENPSESLVMKLNKKKDKFLVERREFVNKMLEID